MAATRRPFYLPYADDLLDIIQFILFRADNQYTVQEIERNTMRRHVFCPSDLGDSSVGSHHDQGRQFVLESAVKEREAFDVEHMHFVNEEDLARH